MEILQIVFLALVALGIVAYAFFTEGLDWIGMAEVVEKRFPVLWGAMNNRPMRLILLAIAVVMLAHVSADLREGAEAPLLKFARPEVPKIDNNVKVITIGTPQKPQCWVANHFGMPNSTIPGAVTATAAILHCNHRIEAPLVVAVEFDRDFIPGAMVVPEAGVMMGVGTEKRGKVFLGRVGSPALLSDQLAIVTVYGPTDQYPRVVRGSIESLK